MCLYDMHLTADERNNLERRRLNDGVATILGWRRITHAVYDWADPSGLPSTLPDFSGDLNVMRSALGILTPPQVDSFMDHLGEILGFSGWKEWTNHDVFTILVATPEQLAKAFLLTL